MKKICLLITAICLVTFISSQAQPVIKKGSLTTGMTSAISVGGAWGTELFGLGFIKSGEYKERILNAMPALGIAVMDNLTVRLQGLISSYSETSGTDDYEWH
jgi:hypothetical protein